MHAIRRARWWLALIVAAITVLPLTTAHAALTDTYIAYPFRAYYDQHQGMRVLGHPQTGMRQINGYGSQYFEKGRIEDHRAETSDPAWAVMYGRLTAELIERAPTSAANSTNLTYADLGRASSDQIVPSAEYTGGPVPVDGGMFVPFHPQLAAAPGYIVPDMFWSYITRSDLFPGGWLHDIGLPLTNELTAQTVKNGQRRTISLQAFERAVLTYDSLNPQEWQVERGNIGTDALRADGTFPAQEVGPKRIEVDLGDQWLYAYAGDELVYDAPVSTGKDGFNTPVGSYAIYLKYESQTMRGSMGGETWVVPDVPHVMYFTGSVALHGAYWHNNFGTGIRSSHGCVNLPLAAADVLFDWAPEGTPVSVRN